MKQIILVRKDLDMPVGKIAVQVAHSVDDRIYDFHTEEAWNANYRTKICVGVKSLDELMKYYSKANELGLYTKLVTDLGITCFNNEPTITCLAIGPSSSEILDKLTKRLRLL